MPADTACAEDVLSRQYTSTVRVCQQTNLSTVMMLAALHAGLECLAKESSTGLRAAVRIAFRPLNRILIAQRVASPQMFVSLVVAALHVGVNHLLVNTLGLGFLGAAWAIGIASFNTTLLTALWVAVAGMQDRVWGRPTWGAFQVVAAFFALHHCHCSQRLLCD